MIPFSTVLSCLYWDSVLLYLHVDSFSWSYLASWTYWHYLITEWVAMAQRVWQPVLAVLQLQKIKYVFLLPCCYYM